MSPNARDMGHPAVAQHASGAEAPDILGLYGGTKVPPLQNHSHFWFVRYCLVDGAGGAGAVDEELVAGGAEASGELGAALGDAAFEVVELAALVALEMMMVGFAGQLVAGGVAGELDGLQPAFLHERLDVSVDGGDAERRMVLLGGAENFFGRERTPGRCEGFADGGLLPCVSFVRGVQVCPPLEEYSVWPVGLSGCRRLTF